MLNEFKKFILRGNVVDMAVGVVIGTAFGKIVSSLVNDVIMPPIGVLIGNVNFKDLAITLKPGYDGVKPVTLNYGVFINEIVHFLIIGFSIFMFVKLMNRLWTREVTEKKCPECAMMMPIEARKCPHCASPVDEPVHA